MKKLISALATGLLAATTGYHAAERHLDDDFSAQQTEQRLPALIELHKSLEDIRRDRLYLDEDRRRLEEMKLNAGEAAVEIDPEVFSVAEARISRLENIVAKRSHDFADTLRLSPGIHERDYLLLSAEFILAAGPYTNKAEGNLFEGAQYRDECLAQHPGDARAVGTCMERSDLRRKAGAWQVAAAAGLAGFAVPFAFGRTRRRNRK